MRSQTLNPFKYDTYQILWLDIYAFVCWIVSLRGMKGIIFVLSKIKSMFVNSKIFKLFSNPKSSIGFCPNPMCDLTETLTLHAYDWLTSTVHLHFHGCEPGEA